MVLHRHRRRGATLLALLSALLISSVVAASAPDRDEIDDSLKWDFDHIYPSFEAWEEAFASLDEMIGTSEAMKGTLADGPQNLLRWYQLQDEAGKTADDDSRGVIDYLLHTNGNETERLWTKAGGSTCRFRSTPSRAG